MEVRTGHPPGGTDAPGDDDILSRFEAEVAPYLTVAPGAVGRAKTLARSLGPRIDAAVIEDSVARLADAWETDEAAQGIAAFLDKRKPPWA